MQSDIRHFDFLRNLLRSRGDVAAGMNTLLNYCRTADFSAATPDLYRLPYEEESQGFTKWVAAVLKEEPPPDSIAALYFGLFYPLLKEKGVTPCLYASGSLDFSPDENQPDWACSPEYFPERRYAPSSVLAAVDSLCSKDQIAGQLLTLGFLGLTVGGGMHFLPRDLTLGRREWRGLAIGYDSGDLYLLPTLTR
jgi:hypothetical protein